MEVEASFLPGLLGHLVHLVAYHLQHQTLHRTLLRRLHLEVVQIQELEPFQSLAVHLDLLVHLVHPDLLGLHRQDPM